MQKAWWVWGCVLSGQLSCRVCYAICSRCGNNRLHVNSLMWNNSIIHATIISGNEQSRTVGRMFNISWENNKMNEYCTLFTTPVIHSDKWKCNWNKCFFYSFFFLSEQTSVKCALNFFAEVCSGSELNKIYVDENNNGFFPKRWVQNNCSHVNEFKASCLQGSGKRREDL